MLQRQLRDTADLIDRATTEFEQRHHQPMPEDNVWLTSAAPNMPLSRGCSKRSTQRPTLPPTAPHRHAANPPPDQSL
ncbi:hypothetical protein [Antrihabitans stalagmiti]|uniref:hypothetical protein n=1 Tax=Antrihabitans stalagmiti TaxID=2799499 RepID=UPI001F2E129B|nr:hypothetical protein [Antrihabitans stalagmiti]